MNQGVSYRPGARFGPAAIREGSRRTLLTGGYNVPQKVDPFSSWATVLDCGDIFMTYVLITMTLMQRLTK